MKTKVILIAAILLTAVLVTPIILSEALVELTVVLSTPENPTNDSPFVVTAQFSGAVTGVTIDDFVVAGGTKDVFVAEDGDTYTVEVTPSPGAVTIDMAGGSASDLDGNVNTVATQLLVTYDNVALTAAITYSTPGPYQSGDTVTITATFNEAVKDSPVPQISISGANILAATDMVKTSTTVYTYLRTIGAGDGTATVAMATAQDLAGNTVTSAPTSGATHTIDNTAHTDIIQQLTTKINALINRVTHLENTFETLKQENKQLENRILQLEMLLNNGNGNGNDDDDDDDNGNGNGNNNGNGNGNDDDDDNGNGNGNDDDD